MSVNEQKKKVEPEKKIRQPTSGFQRHFMFDENDKQLNNPRKVLWKFIFSYLKPYRGTFILFLVLLLIGTAIMSLSPIISASIIDNGIIAQNSLYILNISIIYLSLMIFMAVSNYISQYGMGKVSQRVVFAIRNDLFYKLQDMSLKYFDQHPSGDIISITTNDIDQLNLLVGGQFVMIISGVLSIVLTIIFMYVLNPLLATISLVVFPIFLIMMKVFKKVVTGVFKQTRESISRVTTSIQENIAGAKVVQAYGQEERVSSEFDQANTENYRIMIKIRRIMAVFFPFIGLVTTLITASVLLVGGFVILGNVTILGFTVSVGVLSAYIAILAQFFRPFMNLMAIQQIIESALAATDRIYSLLLEQVEIPDPEHPESYSDVQGEIEFKEVSFGYIFENGGAEESKSEEVPTPQMNMMEQMMQQNPMMKRAFDAIKAFPEPYSSFIQKNMMKIPPNIQQKLFMSLMGSKPEEIPQKIDIILAEFHFAVPNTEMAKNHPEYKTSFDKPEKDPGVRTQTPQLSMMQKMMQQNPMMKRAFDAMKAFPEPYSSFMLKNMMKIPPNIQQKLFMGLMGSKPDDVPQKIDNILAEFHFAVPNTEMAKNHPEYETSFDKKPIKAPGITTPTMEESTMHGMSAGGMGGMMPMNPEFISMMAKNLEKMLSGKSSVMQSGGGGMGGEGGGMMGGGMKMPSPQSLARMLASMPIPDELFQDFPQIVKDAINEQKKLIQHEQSKGYILEDVNFKIDPGTTLAIVGETGAGKTTAVKLLSRFYDINKGSILIDGVDIRKVTKKELRDLIGLVPQDAFIFTGTIRENLLYAYEKVSPEIEKKMIEVSKFLGLHNFIETLHKNYDTKLKENGSNISIGQRQLIAFARALITDPKILVLDEATSSVDPYTETLIQDALNKARKGRTTIIIAHRLSTIKNADQIIVLGKEDHGILEEGTHENLMSLNGKYKRLLEMQSKDIKI
ncbi:MAG: ATP-binding cassette domain-containing protein [Candidatus Lokiarchaeota archaeon]|nr:ATP-binding cassette domain-containing protein [Candidatus Lokiarchaeota archaeon]